MYNIEHRTRWFSRDECRALGEWETQPVLEKMREFFWGPTYHDALPKSDLRRALNYAGGNGNELRAFVSDGCVPLDSNLTQ